MSNDYMDNFRRYSITFHMHYHLALEYQAA